MLQSRYFLCVYAYVVRVCLIQLSRRPSSSSGVAHAAVHHALDRQAKHSACTQWYTSHYMICISLSGHLIRTFHSPLTFCEPVCVLHLFLTSFLVILYVSLNLRKSDVILAAQPAATELFRQVAATCPRTAFRSTQHPISFTLPVHRWLGALLARFAAIHVVRAHISLPFIILLPLWRVL